MQTSRCVKPGMGRTSLTQSQAAATADKHPTEGWMWRAKSNGTAVQATSRAIVDIAVSPIYDAPRM